MLIFQIGVAEFFAEANAQMQTLQLCGWDALEITDFLSPPKLLTNRSCAQKPSDFKAFKNQWVRIST